MKYIVCREPGTFTLDEKPKPLPEKGEALLKVQRVGICGTDLHAFSGNQPFFSYPRILGHELAAEVVEIGENPQGLQPGDKVVIMPYVSCGHCIACRNSKTNCCKELKVLGVHVDGGMQQFVTVRADLLIPANHLSFEEMAIVEPLAIGAHAVRRANIQKNEFVAVAGCGPIGLGLMKFAKIAGAKVVALDMVRSRLEYALEEIGVDYAVDVGDDPENAVASITNGDLCTAVFDATGNKKALESGVRFMAHGGRYVLVGLYKSDLTFHHPTLHARETSLLCSRNATMEDFKHVMENLKAFPTRTFISHQVGMDEMIDHFKSWLNPENRVIKAMVNFQ